MDSDRTRRTREDFRREVFTSTTPPERTRRCVRVFSVSHGIHFRPIPHGGGAEATQDLSSRLSPETATTEFGLELKRARVQAALRRADLEAEVEDVKSDLEHRAYRQKVKLMVRHYKGKVRLGLFRPGTHHLETATSCALVEPALNETAEEIQKELNRQVSKGLIKLTELPVAVTLRLGQDGVVGIWVCDFPLPKQLWAWTKRMHADEQVLGFGVRLREGPGNSLVTGVLQKSVGQMKLVPLEGGPKVHADTFCQANPETAKILYRDVAHFLLGAAEQGRFLDAYAGNGGFTARLKEKEGATVVAVETHPLCQAPLSELTNEVAVRSVADFLAESKPGRFDGIVADPPQKGLKEAALPLAMLQAPRVALVFCNPDAIGRDVPVFQEAGYRICAVVPYDLFGGTPEVETVVYLTLSGCTI